MQFFNNLTERQAKIAEEQDRLRLEEMDEEEYDALSEEEKARVDEKRLVIKKERIKRYISFKKKYSTKVTIMYFRNAEYSFRNGTTCNKVHDL